MGAFRYSRRQAAGVTGNAHSAPFNGPGCGGSSLMRMRALRISLAATLAVVAVTAAFAGPALAIRHGSPDGNGHPYVGIMVAKNASGDPLWRCTGTLLSDRLFMTAGHCVETPA